MSVTLENENAGRKPDKDRGANELRGKDSNPDYLIQSQASYH